MEPIKLEDNLREKLQDRELSPSSTAWETLAEKLEKDGPEPRNKIKWYAIAASFIGIMIIGSVVFSDREILDQDDAVLVEEKVTLPNTELIRTTVNSSKINKKNIASEDQLDAKEIEPNKFEETVVENTNDQIVHSKETPIKDFKTKSSAIKNKKTVLVATANSQEKDKKQVERIVNPKIESISITDLKVNEVVARLKEMKNNNESITDTEINALLAQAQKEIKIQKLLKSNKIDAASLLLDVEQELETSFRDKVFNALGNSYKIIRTAVSDRNH